VAEVLIQIDDEDARSLGVAAALGERVYGEEWFPVLDALGLALPHRSLHHLLRAGLIRRHADGFEWASPAVRTAFESGVGPIEHRVIAKGLEGLPPGPRRELRLGLHLLWGGRPREARRVLFSLGALDPSTMEFARQAVDALRPFMDGTTPEELIQFLLMDLRVHLNLVSGPAAVPVARQLIEALGLPGVPGTLDVSAVPKALQHEAWSFAARVFAFEAQHADLEALLGRLPETSTTLRCAGIAAQDRGDLVTAERLIRRAIALADAPTKIARLANSPGGALGMAGRHEQAIEWFDVCIAQIEPELLFVPYGNKALSLLVLERPGEALGLARTAFEIVQHRGALRVAAAVFVYALAALIEDEDEFAGVADQALFSVRRYGVGRDAPYAEVLRRVRPGRPASRAWVEAVSYALSEHDE
jgi:hypothetical protein